MSALVGISFITHRMSLGRKIHHPAILTRDMYEYASHIHRKCITVGWYNQLDSRLVRLNYNITYNHNVSVSCIMYVMYQDTAPACAYTMLTTQKFIVPSENYMSIYVSLNKTLYVV